MNEKLGFLAKIQIAVGAAFLFIFMATVCVQMGCRYAGIPATWTEDVSMYSFIWATFMGAAAMVYEKRHFAFTSVSDMIKNHQAKLILALIINLLMLFFTVLMTKYGIEVTKQFWNYTWNNVPSFKRGPTWMCLPISGATSSLYLIAQIIDNITDITKGGKK